MALIFLRTVMVSSFFPHVLSILSVKLVNKGIILRVIIPPAICLLLLMFINRPHSLSKLSKFG